MVILALLASAASAGAQPPGEGDLDQAIIVIGERVRRTVKETPSSVAIETRQDLEARPADRVDQVLAAIANVQLGNGSQGPAIRGQDTTGALSSLPAFLGGNRPRMTLVVDGRAETYTEFVFGSAPLWDVERIEVFRTPQTTTQGQNSIAGAIFVYTGDPTFEPEYRVRASVGTFHMRQLSALVSAPVGRDVAIRVAGDLRYSRTTSRIVDRNEGGDPNHDVYGLLRAKLLATPAGLPGTRLTMTYAHQVSQAPQLVRVTLPFRERHDVQGGYGVFHIKSDSLTAIARHESGALTANIVLGAGASIAERLAPKGFGQALNKARDWSSEAVASWQPEGPLRLTGGIALRHNKLRQRIDLSVLAGIPKFRDWQDGTGIFGEASVRLGGRATLTAGLRYQQDRQKRIGAFETASGPIDLDYDRTFRSWLPKLSLAYDVSRAVTAGLLAQKAYNPGGTTLRFDTGEPDNFDAERLWDYEAFVRGALPGGRLSVSGNAFYYDIRNAQRSQDIRIRAPNGLTVGFADLFNVPKASTYGAEVEVEWRPSPRLSARAALGLLRTRVIASGPDYPQMEGTEFDRSPHLTGSAAIDWRPTGRLSLSAQIRHHGPYWSAPLESPQSRVESGTIADLRGEYGFGRLSLFAYARNIFDTFSIVSRDDLTATLEDPREIGVGLDARF